MEVSEGLFEALCRTSRGLYIPLDKVCGVSVCGNICSLECSHRQPNTYLRFTINSDWLNKPLFTANINNEQELKDLFSKVLPSLEYDKLTNRLFVEIGDNEEKLVYDLLKLMPKNDNVVLSYQECSVCLDNCNTKTSCNHFICGICESNLTTKKCPICRDYYIHSANENDEE